MLIFQEDGQACLYDLDLCAGKTFPVPFQVASRRAKISESFSRRLSALSSIPYQSLDLTPGSGNLLGEFYWEILSPWRGDASMLNTGICRKDATESSLWQILEERPLPKYYLTRKACLGILRRAEERGKELPPQLKEALEVQAGLRKGSTSLPVGESYHVDQHDEGADLPAGIDSKHACATGGVANTLSTTCGSPTGRNGVFLPMAFAQNQRDEVRDLHDVAGALGAQPGMKQQTFVAAGVVSKGDGTCFLMEDTHTALTSGGGQAGQGYPCILSCMETQTESKCIPTGWETLCLNDQGGRFMSISDNISATLRAQMHGHQPILLESNQNHATVRTDGISTTLPASMGMGGGYVPMVYENYGKDCRYKGPLQVAPTMSAAYGTGGNNVPLVEQTPKAFCIVGNIIDRQPENGGNGVGCQENLAYTLTSMDRHAVCDTTYRQVVGALCRGDEKGVGSQYVSQDKCVIEGANLIRHLTPLECERLQGFPDYWTDIPGASDSARYKALGNSVAVPCVDFVMNGMRLVLESMETA